MMPLKITYNSRLEFYSYLETVVFFLICKPANFQKDQKLSNPTILYEDMITQFLSL